MYSYVCTFLVELVTIMTVIAYKHCTTICTIDYYVLLSYLEVDTFLFPELLIVIEILPIGMLLVRSCDFVLHTVVYLDT